MLSEFLRGWGEIRMVLFALLVLLIARLYPEGLVGLFRLAGQRLAPRVPALAGWLAPQRTD